MQPLGFNASCTAYVLSPARKHHSAPPCAPRLVPHLCPPPCLPLKPPSLLAHALLQPASKAVHCYSPALSRRRRRPQQREAQRRRVRQRRNRRPRQRRRRHSTHVPGQDHLLRLRRTIAVTHPPAGRVACSGAATATGRSSRSSAAAAAAAAAAAWTRAWTRVVPHTDSDADPAAGAAAACGAAEAAIRRCYRRRRRGHSHTAAAAATAAVIHKPPGECQETNTPSDREARFMGSSGIAGKPPPPPLDRHRRRRRCCQQCPERLQPRMRAPGYRCRHHLPRAAREHLRCQWNPGPR